MKAYRKHTIREVEAIQIIGIKEDKIIFDGCAAWLDEIGNKPFERNSVGVFHGKIFLAEKHGNFVHVGEVGCWVVREKPVPNTEGLIAHDWTSLRLLSDEEMQQQVTHEWVDVSP